MGPDGGFWQSVLVVFTSSYMLLESHVEKMRASSGGDRSLGRTGKSEKSPWKFPCCDSSNWRLNRVFFYFEVNYTRWCKRCSCGYYSVHDTTLAFSMCFRLAMCRVPQEQNDIKWNKSVGCSSRLNISYVVWFLRPTSPSYIDQNWGSRFTGLWQQA